MFLSKFVFLEVIDLLFGKNVEISGLAGLIAIIVSMMVLTKAATVVFERLAD